MTLAAPRAGRPDLERHVLGAYETARPGPTVVLVGGLHGNEPAGVYAIRAVLAELERRALPLRGRVVGLAGNLGALRRGDRFLDRDLNRMWSATELAPGAPSDASRDAAERAALHALVERALADAREPVVFLDLHSTSADGAPFSIIGDTLQNRRIAFALPVPVILGLEENVEGALLGYFGERGHVAVGFEGGQHDAESTQAHHVAAVWLTLLACGALTRAELPEAAEYHALLRRAARGLPGVVEMRYRHHVEPADEFEMRPGFTNFDAVRAGQVLARDARGEIACPEDGFVLLPLYQGQGQDGFFVGREVRRVWLRLSRVVRAARLDRLAPLLPGIRRVRGERGTLEVDRHVARWWVVEIFHLLGFRRVRPAGGALRFTRRVEGLERSERGA
ncbi:MAG: succinylglutamate desuccinylase/aspartoacylase family protein [Planctomycetes bacterium]|nr:succinylglutamate desuccinylase/aspartoacylase family protein [Planctomycetota bacterium]